MLLPLHLYFFTIYNYVNKNHSSKQQQIWIGVLKLLPMVQFKTWSVLKIHLHDWKLWKTPSVYLITVCICPTVLCACGACVTPVYLWFQSSGGGCRCGRRARAPRPPHATALDLWNAFVYPVCESDAWPRSDHIKSVFFYFCLHSLS